MKHRSMTILSLIASLAILLTACQSAATPTQAPAVQPTAAESATPEPTAAPLPTPTIQPTEANLEPQDGGTLVLRESGVVQFDPPLIADDPSFHVASQIYSFLFRVVDNQAIPDLATSWDYQDEGKTVVFHLREGMTFQDDNPVFPKGQGREVVADDVVYSINRMINLEGTQVAADLATTFNSVEAVDAHTVKLHLKTPDALLFTAGRGLSSTGIVPKEAVEQLGDQWGSNPIGSGPFKFVSYKPDNSVTLVRNENYYIRPHLDGIVFKIIPDDDTATMSLEAGEVQQLWNLSATQFAQFQDNPDFVLVPEPNPNPYNLQLVLSNPLFADKNVREAIAHAIDGRGIMQAVYGGLAVGGCGTAGQGVPGYDPDLCDKYFKYDLALSEQLLTDAGWAKNASGTWEKGGAPLSFEIEAWNLDPMPKVMTAVVTQLQEAGMDVKLNTVEFGTWIADYTGGKTTDAVAWMGFAGDGGLNTYWGATGMSAAGGFHNEDVYALLDQANTQVDPEERDATLKQATDLIFQDYPDVPLGFFQAYDVFSAKVHDFKALNWFENITTEANNVWIEQ